MQQSEILAIVDKLIPVYHAKDFEDVLSMLTMGEPSSTKLLIKMELKKVMTPCRKSIDLRGKVRGECREYELDGIKHWFDDVAFNDYYKQLERFGGYTEGMWETLNNTRNNFRVMASQKPRLEKNFTDADSPFEAEPIHLGYHLKRQEKRLRLQSQVDIKLSQGQILHGLSIDISNSGGKFKVPSAFNYKLGESIFVTFTEIAKSSELISAVNPIEFRILAVEETLENEAIKVLRTVKISDTNIINDMIEEVLNTESKRTQHDNQDKFLSARTKGFEHIFLKHTCHLPLFFKNEELKLAMLTVNNAPLWQYWHDERNQQVLGALFHQQRMKMLVCPQIKGSSNMLYSFTHEHEKRTHFYSMLMPEATREERQLFWHLGSKRSSWRAFRINLFKLSDEEKQQLASFNDELGESANNLTHCGILHEVANAQNSIDYQLTEKPALPSSTLNKFHQTRKIIGRPKGIYFDAKSRRKEHRYPFKTPVSLSFGDKTITGHSIDFSKRGLNLELSSPLLCKINDSIQLDFKELKLYDKKLPLDKVPYSVVRISPDGLRIQLAIEETSQTVRIIAFMKSIIEQNQDKLIAQEEILPSNELLNSLHRTLLNKLVTSPVFIDKQNSIPRTRIIGANYPLARHLDLFAKLGHKGNLSMEPVFKGRTNTLIANGIKKIEGAQPQHHEVYLGVVMLGKRIIDIVSHLTTDFNSIKDRIRFIQKSVSEGEFYALRISTAPIFSPITSLLDQELQQLTQINIQQTAKLETELTSTCGYCEIEDVTQEVITRLEIFPR